MQLYGKSIRSWYNRPLNRFFMVDPLSYFSFQAVIQDSCNKGHGMYYPVCEMVHIKEPLLLIRKSSPCSGGNRFSEWSLTICLMLYNYIKNVFDCVIKYNIFFIISDGVMGHRIDPSWGGRIELFLVPASAPQLV